MSALRLPRWKIRIRVTKHPAGRPVGGTILGAVYPVMEIYCYPNIRRYRVIGEKTALPIIDEDIVAIEDNKLPSDMAIEIASDVTVIRPEETMGHGFWERYFDDDPDAIQRVAAAVSRIRLAAF